MKKLAKWIIVSSWALYVLVPILYRLYYGSYPENIQSLGAVPDEYMTKAAIIITVSLLASVFFIQVLPGGEAPIKETIECGPAYYYVALALYMILAVRAGATDFYKVVTGGTNGSLLAYYSMLFYPIILYLIFLFCVKRKGGILVLSGSYLMLTLLTRSRSGAVMLGIYLVGFAFATDMLSLERAKRWASEVYKKYKTQVRLVVIALVILAPLIFIYSTQSRDSVASNAAHSLFETIAARCSCLDEAGLALYKIEEGGAAERVFREKYGIIHQLQCIIDSTIPGSLFGGDVDSNQYYRVVVGYMSAEDAARYYNSVNLMLPVYLVMKNGIIPGTILSIIVIVGYYLAILRMKKNAWQVILLTVVFQELIYYFDWAMIWRSFLRAALTILTFEIITRFVHFQPSFQKTAIRLKLPEDDLWLLPHRTEQGTEAESK